MTKPEAILKTKNLCIGYSDSTVAKHINISLDSGKLITIVGANGIGKSTLLRTITGIQKPIEGSVTLFAKELHTYDSLELARHLSLVLTERLPQSNTSVFDLVALGRQPYTNWLGKLTFKDIEVVNYVLKLTQTEDLAHKKHYQISDGQLQRVMIARALAQDTSMIVLDEPTTHLDLFHKVSVFRLLKNLSRETQKCILFSTHDIDLAIQLADEMIVMTADQVIQDQPCNLITRGVFDTLFNDKAILFDREKGKFVVKG